MRIQIQVDPFIEKIEKIEKLIKIPTVLDETIYQATLQLFIDLEAHIQKTVAMPLKLTALQAVRGFSAKVQHFFNDKKIKSELPEFLESIKPILENLEMIVLFTPKSAEEKDIDTETGSQKRKDVFASFVARIGDLLKLINEKSIEDIYLLTMKLFGEILIYATTEMPSAEGKWTIFQLETYMSTLADARKYNLLTKGPLIELLSYLKTFFSDKDKMKLILQIVDQQGALSEVFTSHRERIWQIINKEIRRDISLVPCSDSFGNTVYQTQELVDEPTAKKIIAAFNKENQSAFSIPSKKEGWFYISIPFRADWASLNLDETEYNANKHDLLKLSDMKLEFKEDKNNKDLALGNAIIKELRATTKMPVDILPKKQWPDKPEIRARIENIEECLKAGEQWTQSISQIARLMPPTLKFPKSMVARVEVINRIARGVVCIKSCGFGDGVEIAFAAFYELAKKNIFPIDLVQIAQDQDEPAPGHMFVLAKRSSKKELTRLKDLDVLNKEAFVVDPFLKLSCSAKNYRLQPSAQDHSFTYSYSKKGKAVLCCRLENENDLRIFIHQVERLQEWVDKNRENLPKEKPIVKFHKPYTEIDPSSKVFREVMLLNQLIQIHINMEQSRAETAALIDSLPPFRFFARLPKIDMSLNWVNYQSLNDDSAGYGIQYTSDEAFTL